MAKKNNTTRRVFKRRPTTYQRIAKIARNVVRASKPVKEVRFHNFAPLKTDVLANSFNVTDITNISPGSAADQRDGRNIVLLGCRYTFSFDNARVEERYIRMLCVQPKNVNDPPDLGTWQDLYQDNNYNNRTADMLVGDITHPINTDVWKIYYDKTIKLSSIANEGTTKTFSGYLKFNKRLMYDGDGAMVNVPVSGGQIYFIIHACENYSTSGTTATVTNFDGFFRVFFKDT